MSTSTLPKKELFNNNITSSIRESIKHQNSFPLQYGANRSSMETIPFLSEDKIIVFGDIKRKSQIKEHELEWWVGKVINIHDKYFTAILEDLSGKTNIVEFEKDVIDPNDNDLLFIGSRFTYSISVIDKPTGREYVTKLAFSARRRWLKEYEEKAKKLADEIFPEDILNM